MTNHTLHQRTSRLGHRVLPCNLLDSIPGLCNMEATSQVTVLGKRKGPAKTGSLVLIVNTSTEESDFEPSTSKATPRPILVNGSLVSGDTKKRYKCTHEGCEKAYSKPSRLAEHERSHTNERPFTCTTCKKAYLRESHLHAHARSHLPESARSFRCDRPNCEKRFWTSQHLRTHQSWHDGAKPYQCKIPGCNEAFSKHSQLRAHLCQVHSPPGTKPYQCTHDGCTKSFDTNQHLITHQKTHDTKRYACVHAMCLSKTDGAPFFATWSALQSHIRMAHPPTCLHPSCNGRIFSNHSNLRAHLKLHETRQITKDLNPESEEEGTISKRQRLDDFGRDWVCDFPGCSKDFKSKKALNTHVHITHHGRRDFTCDHPGCGKAFGYKHLLQRHTAKLHPSFDVVEESESSDDEGAQSEGLEFDIDKITGKSYSQQAEARLKEAKALACPFPSLQHFVVNYSPPAVGPAGCQYVFTRAYDLRRHLATAHQVDAEKDMVDQWVKNARPRNARL
ncbi:transcription factor iiia [Panaeolus papilionaceus]|nr:transcription factor iiia [Panaeolus papilionaceus]